MFGFLAHLYYGEHIFQRLGDGTDGAATLVLHGLPHFQLSSDPPPDALQIQASVKLSSTQGNAKKTTNDFSFKYKELNERRKKTKNSKINCGTHSSLPGLILT